MINFDLLKDDYIGLFKGTNDKVYAFRLDPTGFLLWQEDPAGDTRQRAKNLPENPMEEQLKFVMLEVLRSQVTRGNVQQLTEMDIGENGELIGIFVMDDVNFKFSYDKGKLVFSRVDSNDLK